MQKWIGQQLRLFNRQAGNRESDTQDKMAARKAAYLAKLGLGAKAQEVKEATKKRPWHIDHIAEGDVFRGSFSHPDLARGEPVDVTLNVASSTGGTWASAKGQFEGEFEIEQDFPIAFEKGQARDESMAAYIFNKFNIGWRQWATFSGPKPSSDDLEYLSLRGMQLFFRQVAEVENFPGEGIFTESVADASKGMTVEEFLKYIKEEDPEYLDGAFPNVYTGRRVRIGNEDLLLDGDFQAEADGTIFGYAYLEGKEGGAFKLELVKKAS